jgi:hypothetical protein
MGRRAARPAGQGRRRQKLTGAAGIGVNSPENPIEVLPRVPRGLPRRSFRLLLMLMLPYAGIAAPKNGAAASAPPPVRAVDFQSHKIYQSQARDTPGYDSWNSKPLAERMKLGGKILTVRTGADGTADLALPEFDGITSIHASYQMVIRFNAEHQYPDYQPAQLPQLEYYANSGLDP